MTSILIVDDHKIMRDGLRAILRFSGEFDVVAEAESGQQAVELALELHPQLILMDISLPGMSGLEATVEILKRAPEIRVVILSMYDDDSSVMQAMRSGARAFVLKKASHDELVDALRTVARGGSYFSAEVSDHLLGRVRKGDLHSGRGSRLDSLTPRELQVMRLIAAGSTSKEIAIELDLSLETVRGYRKTLMRKLAVTGVAALTQLALAHGLTSPNTRAAGSGG